MKKFSILPCAVLLLLSVPAEADQPKTEDVRGLANRAPPVLAHWDVYRTRSQSWKYGKEAPQNFWSERATIAERQDASENEKSEAKPTQPDSNFVAKFGISADFLVWFASQEASAVWADVIEIGFNTSSFGVPDFRFGWDLGFRLGAGYHFAYDEWDTQLHWTWFRTEDDQSQSVPVGSGTIHPELFAADLSDDDAQSAKIKWSLLFNMFDWELGRSYWVSKGLSLRPFIGLKGGWIYQALRVKYKHLTINNVLTANSAVEHAKNSFWGAGPLGGIATQWKLRDFSTHYPSLFGDFSAATLWGSWECTDNYKNTADAKVTVNMNKLRLGGLMLRGFMGLGWDVAIHQGASHFAARLGYEMQLWVNQLRLPTSQLVPLHGDLTLQGMTFNCRFDF